MSTEDKLRRADIIPLEDLALYWQGRANALRMVDAAAKKSNEATIKSATAYEECAVEIRAALAATQEQPVPGIGPFALSRAIEMLRLGRNGRSICFCNDEIDALLAALRRAPSAVSSSKRDAL